MRQDKDLYCPVLEAGEDIIRVRGGERYTQIWPHENIT
jgi:hypothetical protein